MEKHNPAKFRSKKNSSRSNKIFFHLLGRICNLPTLSISICNVQ